MNRNFILVYILLILIVPSTAHENHNEIFTADENYWTWDSGLKNSYTWKMTVWDEGDLFVEGKINLFVKEELTNYNLLDYFKNNETVEFEEYTNKFFDIEFEEKLEVFESSYPAKYFLAPINFYHENGTQYNLLETGGKEDFVFVGLIDETIDKTCIQGCHTEQINPFNTSSSNMIISDETATIKGTFIVKDYFKRAYGYEGGTFQAQYDLDGVLQSWDWESNNGLEKLIISRNALSSSVINSILLYVVMPVTVFAVMLYYVFKKFLPKLASVE